MPLQTQNQPLDKAETYNFTTSSYSELSDLKLVVVYSC